MSQSFGDGIEFLSSALMRGGINPLVSDLNSKIAQSSITSVPIPTASAVILAISVCVPPNTHVNASSQVTAHDA